MRTPRHPSSLLRILLLFVALPALALTGRSGPDLETAEPLALPAGPAGKLSLSMVVPRYRHAIFRTSPIRTVRLSAALSTRTSPAELRDGHLAVELFGPDRTRVRETMVVADIAENWTAIPIEIDVADLAPGSYLIRVQLMDRNNGWLDVAQLPLYCYGPARNEVVFDPWNRCLVNGEPFFPIGIYHVWKGWLGGINEFRAGAGQAPLTWDAWMQELAQAGFNCFNDWQMHQPPDEWKRRLNSAHEHRLMSVVHLESLTDITTAREHPAMLAWYGGDEPPPTVTPVLQQNYHDARRLDPYHPYVGAAHTVDRLQSMAPYFDALLPDFYPRGGGDPRHVLTGARAAVAAKAGRAPIWPVIQAFELTYYGKDANGEWYSFPRLSLAEMRLSVYLNLIAGAKGIFYYAYCTSERVRTPGGTERRFYYVHDFPDQWEAMRSINRELEDLAPIALAVEELAATVAPDNGHLFVLAKRLPDRTVTVLLANSERAPATAVVAVDTLASPTGRALFTDLEVAAAAGTFELNMPPLGTQVLRFRPATGSGN